MITLGFVPSYSDAVTVGQPFTINGLIILSAYIYVSGSSGDIVWLNNKGQANWFPGAQAGQAYILGASQIVSSATVNGTSRATTATGLIWVGVNQQFNTP